MANLRNGNTYYIDSTAEILDEKALVVYIIVTATAANGRIVLADLGNGTAQTKLDLRVATSGDSEAFPFDAYPVLFPNGIRVVTLSNAVATLVLTKAGG